MIISKNETTSTFNLYSCQAVRFYLILIFFIFIFLNITPIQAKMKIGETRLIEKSGDSAIKSAGGSETFVGVSKNVADEQTARNEAVLDARRKILQSLEIRIDATQDFDRLIIEDQTGITERREQFNSRTIAVAKGVLSVKPEGYYVEKLERKLKKGVEYEYKAWCLIRYSQAEHRRLVTSMVTTMLEAAEPLIKRAETERQSGQIRDALRTIGQLRELTADMADYPAVPVKLKPQINQLTNRVAKLIQSIKLLVAIYERVEGEQVFSRQFQSRLAEALTEMNVITIQSSMNWSDVNPNALLSDRNLQQMVAQQQETDMLLVGIAEVKRINDSKAKYGIYSASMRAQLKLVDPSTGSILWETTIPGDLIKDTKEFANNGDDAAMNALSLTKLRKKSGSENPFVLLAEDILKAIE
ncbi:MAG: hypothetical protein P9X24_13555 [Candidatus Hatepunaea meridiana]|nr:hypothetical protein [Candidatus Hatepunaea meridiana]